VRILLASNSPYYPSFGGGNKSNRLLMEALAARGHRVQVVTRTRDFGEEAHRTLLAQLNAAVETVWGISVTVGGVEIHTLTRDSKIRLFLAQGIEAFDPEIIFTSTDDTAHVMYEVALQAPRARVVYLIRATVALPFGPDGTLPSESLTLALRTADGVLTVSEYVAEYARRWGGLDAKHVPISLLEPDESLLLGSYDNRFITMINPCAVKGLSIFLGLADSFPQLEFAAVPTWGTTEEDLAALRQRPNMTVLPAVEEIDEIYRQTRIAIVPSIWAEARSRVILEAMSRGIPVLASDVGGLAEAMLGIGKPLPVSPVTRYERAIDESMVPAAVIPAQDLAPWREALARLTQDRGHYEAVAHESRQAALGYKQNLNAGPLEAYLAQLLASPRKSRNKPAATARLALSESQRKLLALRMKKKATE